VERPFRSDLPHQRPVTACNILFYFLDQLHVQGRLIGEAAVRAPTGTMPRIDFGIEGWQQINYERGQLKWLIPPKLAGPRITG
jgi:hypothetical protein